MLNEQDKQDEILRLACEGYLLTTSYIGAPIELKHVREGKVLQKFYLNTIRQPVSIQIFVDEFIATSKRKGGLVDEI